MITSYLILDSECLRIQDQAVVTGIVIANQNPSRFLWKFCQESRLKTDYNAVKINIL